MDIHFTTHVFKEGRTFVAHNPQLDVSSCGGTKQKALSNLREAVRLFLEEAANMGTLEQILEEAGYLKKRTGFTDPSWSVPRNFRFHSPGMPSLRPVSYKSLARVFEAAGFTHVRTEGDHMVFTKHGVDPDPLNTTSPV